jgi:hypothetical protein
VQNLKPLSRDKRAELLSQVAAHELESDVKEPEQENSEPITKRKRKRSSLISAASRRASNAVSEISWVKNLEQTEKPQVKDSWTFKCSDELTSFDDIYERFSHGYYHSLVAVEQDLNSLFHRVIETRCLNKLAKVYL